MRTSLPDGCPRSACVLHACPFDIKQRKLCNEKRGDERSEEPQPLSLDIYVSSNASINKPLFNNNIKFKKPFTPDQKRRYGRSLSFMAECAGTGYQLFWVMLSTVVGDVDNGAKIMRHWAELQRRIVRKYGYPALKYLCVQTNEGGGVLHLVVGIKWSIPARISQSWMSYEWEKIHGAKIVWISRMGKGSKDHKNVSRYLVTQYMMDGQGSAFKRLSYSWWHSSVPLGRGWRDIKREFNLLRRANDKFQDCINSWRFLLSCGQCVLCGIDYYIHDRNIQLKPA